MVEDEPSLAAFARFPPADVECLDSINTTRKSYRLLADDHDLHAVDKHKPDKLTHNHPILQGQNHDSMDGVYEENG
jgi:hypothetical protein